MKIPRITSQKQENLSSDLNKESKKALKAAMDKSVEGAKGIFEFAQKAVKYSAEGIKDIDPKEAMAFLAAATMAILGANTESDEDKENDSSKEGKQKSKEEVNNTTTQKTQASVDPKADLASLKSKVETEKAKSPKKQVNTAMPTTVTGPNNTVPKTSVKKPNIRSEYTKIPSGKKFKDVQPILFYKIRSQIPDHLLGTPKAIVMAVELCKAYYVIGAHCSACVANVYEVAGVKKGKSKKFFDTMPRYTLRDSKGRLKKNPDCGTQHLLYAKRAEFIQKGRTPQEANIMAVEYLQDTLKPGAHLITCNSNKYSPWGAHSEIFMGWINKGKCIAKVAGYGGSNRRPYIRNKRLGPGNRKSRIVRSYNIKGSKKSRSTAVA